MKTEVHSTFTRILLPFNADYVKQQLSMRNCVTLQAVDATGTRHEIAIREPRLNANVCKT